MQLSGTASFPADPQRDVIAAWLREEDRLPKIGVAIRTAIDWVIDGARTQRYSLVDVEQSEKLYLGNRVEHEVLYELDLVKNPTGIDTTICETKVDVKFSISDNWMIPPEALNELCLMLTADDTRSVYSVGMFRALPGHLGAENRDKKRSITKLGKSQIDWIAADAPLPTNFLLHLTPDVRAKILEKRSGQAKVTEAFRLVQGRAISIVAIDTLAVQRDPSKRVRDARIALERDRIKIFSGRYDSKTIKELGLPEIGSDEWVSFSTDAEPAPLP